MIKVVSNLELFGNRLICRDIHGKENEVTHLQGTLDGACAIYSLMMNLLILRCIGHKDTRIYVEHKDRATKNLFKILTENEGMHRNGRSFNWLQRRIRDYFGTIVSCDRKETIDETAIEQIVNVIDDDLPVIISVVGRNWAHAMLAVGYESDEHDENEPIKKIFCLDPSGDNPKYSFWNAVIDVTPNTKATKYKYQYSNAFSTLAVSLDDILIIDNI